MYKKLFIITAIVAVIALAGIAYFAFYKPATAPEANNNVETANNINSQPTPAAKYKYEYISNYKENAPVTDSSFDGKIVRTDLSSNQKTTIVPSVKAAYPPLKQSSNLTFGVLYAPKEGDVIYFDMIFSETDAPPKDIIRYTGETNKFTKLTISKYFTGLNASASKESSFVASTFNPENNSDEKSLYLLDLSKDTAKLMTTLPAGQTFNQCFENNCLGGYYSVIEWFSATQFQINIYSSTQTDKDQYGTITNKLLEKRKFNLN